MGLSVVAGSLAEALDEDYSVEGLRAVFEAINSALSKSGLPAHIEPESLPALPGYGSVNGFPYSCLHYLRRAYAYRVKYPDLPLPQPTDGEDPAEDPIIERVATPEHHLLWHSDCEGYYVPIDFETVIEDDDVPGGLLGSSQRLFQELVLVAPTLGVTLEGQTLSGAQAERIDEIIDAQGPLFTELMVWILLFGAAGLSIEYGTAIRFN